MKVKDILNFLNIPSNDEFNITFLTDDSKKVNNESIYICTSSYRNAFKYIKEAENNNAYFIICKYKIKGTIYVSNLENKIYELLRYFYNFKPMFKLIGITGTEGKSSLSNFLLQSLLFNRKKVINICTSSGSNSFVSSLTTPKIFDLFDIFQIANNIGVEYLIMEVSSIGISENRVQGIQFDYLFLTNLTSDHLDYHKSLKKYHLTKINFLNSQTCLKFIPFDIKYHILNCKLINRKMVEIIQKMPLNFIYKKEKYLTNFVFDININNLIFIIEFLKMINFETDEIINTIQNIQPLKGRMDVVCFSPLIVIDYAHTFTSFENSLIQCKKTFNKKIVLIFGAGGDRDKSKRKNYSLLADRYADIVILTNDNPRNEDEDKIINDLKIYLKNYLIIKDRKLAIEYAIKNLEEEQMLLILGKGNEEYIFSKGNKIEHNDYHEVKKWI